MRTWTGLNQKPALGGEQYTMPLVQRSVSGRIGAKAQGNGLIVEPLTEIPEPDLVEVVETQTPGHRVEEAGVGYIGGNDVRELSRLEDEKARR